MRLPFSTNSGNCDIEAVSKTRRAAHELSTVFPSYWPGGTENLRKKTQNVDAWANPNTRNSSHFHEKILDERLRNTTDRVRNGLFSRQERQS